MGVVVVLERYKNLEFTSTTTSLYFCVLPGGRHLHIRISEGVEARQRDARWGVRIRYKRFLLFIIP